MEESTSNMLYTTIGELIQKYREQSHLTLSQLAKITGISKGVLSKIESGDTKRPELKTINPLAKTLQIPYSEVVEHYIEVEKRIDTLHELLLLAIQLSDIPLVSKVASRFLQSPQEESYTALERLYTLTHNVNETPIKLALLDVIIKYARERGMQHFVAKGLLQKYLIERDDFSKLDVTYHSGKFILDFQDFLSPEEMIILSYKLGVHAYNLRLYDECIAHCEFVVREDHTNSRIKADSVSAILNSYYYLGNYDLTEHYLQLFSRFPFPDIPVRSRFMIGAINAKKGNLALASAQLQACLADSSENMIIHVANELLEIYLQTNDRKAMKELFKLENKITSITRVTPFKKSELAYFYKLKGDYEMMVGHFEEGIACYSKSAVEYGKIAAPSKVQECVSLIVSFYESIEKNSSILRESI